MKRDVIIIGGGVAGLMTAYSLIKAKRSVTIIDEGNIANCSSFGNAGLLSAFDKAPLSSPGVVTDTLKLMLKGESPVNIHFKLDSKIFRWLYQFVKNANENRVKRTLALFEKYGQQTIDLYKQMEIEGLDLDFHHDGMLSVFTEQKTFDKKLASYNFVDEERFEILDKQKLKEYLPFGNEKIKGGILFKRNAHFDPKRVMTEMKNYLLNNGVEFIKDKITDIKFEGDKVSKIVSSLNNSYEADTFVLCTGYQTLLADIRKQELMMTPAKGYSLTFSMPKELQPKTSTLFADLFIVMTPRRDDVRVTSKLEIGSNSIIPVEKQINSIKENLKKYTTSFEMENIIEWAGFRPLTPNDMPLIGRDEKYKNLVYGMGLGWLGMTFAPSIGEILKDLIVKNIENKKSDDILLFSGFYQG